MDEQITSVSPQKRISLKRVVAVSLIAILAFTSLVLAYLYLSEVSRDTNSPDTSSTQDGENEETEEGVICDFDKLKGDAQKDNARVKLAYEYILEPNASPASPYAACKETLKTTIKNIFTEQEDITSDKEELAMLKSEIDEDMVKYLIDDIFVVYTPYGKIWEVDIVKETVDLLWEIESESRIGIYDAHIISEYNTSRMFFSTKVDGLGGATEEDNEAIDNLIEQLCKEKDLAIWMYDTATEAVTRIADSEQCL